MTSTDIAYRQMINGLQAEKLLAAGWARENCVRCCGSGVEPSYCVESFQHCRQCNGGQWFWKAPKVSEPASDSINVDLAK